MKTEVQSLLDCQGSGVEERVLTGVGLMTWDTWPNSGSAAWNEQNLLKLGPKSCDFSSRRSALKTEVGGLLGSVIPWEQMTEDAKNLSQNVAEGQGWAELRWHVLGQCFQGPQIANKAQGSNIQQRGHKQQRKHPKKPQEPAREGLVVKITSYSCKGPRFSFQSVTLVSGNLMPSSGLCEPQAHRWNTGKHAGKHPHIK